MVQRIELLLVDDEENGIAHGFRAAIRGKGP